MLTAKGIVDAMSDGDIVISPFSSIHLQPNSYDITLGPWIIRYREKAQTIESISPMTQYLSDSPWNMFEQPSFSESNIQLNPWERILCHTMETFGTRHKYVAKLATRSRIGRWGLDICGSAGFGDVGFVNKWTMELQNCTNFRVILDIGARIGQVYFDELIGKEEGFTYHGEFMNSDGSNWKPEDMLPKSVRRI